MVMNRVVAGKLLKQAIRESTEEEGRDCSWMMLRLVDLVVEYEREECAKVCDERATADGWEGCYADQCAAAIRSRT